MERFDPAKSFGEEASRRYDAVETRGDEEATVAFLARLAGGREALEFAVGTGRVALPLVASGVRVDGIEVSQHMVDRMREKPGGTDVDVIIGDMSAVSTGRTYGLVRLRLAQPSEFDLRARIAGLRLRDRWGGWRGEPFSAASWRHVSVYERATAGPPGRDN